MLGPNKSIRQKWVDPYELPNEDELDDEITYREPERPRVDPWELPEDDNISDDDLYDKLDWSSQPIYQ